MPSEYRYIHYAFHLSSKEIAVGNKAPLGFVEFYGVTGKRTHAINNRRVLTEGIDRKSVGVYPHIRLRIERKDRGRILTTRTADNPGQAVFAVRPNAPGPARAQDS